MHRPTNTRDTTKSEPRLPGGGDGTTAPTSDGTEIIIEPAPAPEPTRNP